MIFRQIQQVLDGDKTQTRRVMKAGEYGWCGGHRIVHGLPSIRYTEVCLPNNHRKWAVGETYAVQPGRGKHSLGRIRITEIRRERVQAITLADIIAEGIKSVSVDGVLEGLAWQMLWESINTKRGDRWIDDPLAWALTFQLALDG